MAEYEVDILVDFSRDFCKQKELAGRLGKSEAQIRRTFSRVYEKLEAPLAVENPAQLAHLLASLRRHG